MARWNQIYNFIITIDIRVYMKQQRQPSQLITFLENQNKSLREQVKSYRQLLQLNRKALKIALAPRQNEQSLPVLVSLLFEENTKILSRTALLREQIEKKSCEALISEQIASASNEHEKYVASELKDRLRILRKEIQSKDKHISELQKQLKKDSSLEGEDETVQGLIEYTDITKISQKLFKEAEFLRREVDLQSQEVSKYKQQKQQLIKLNLILTKQVNELKAYSCQSTGSQKRDFNTSSSDLSKFLKYQAKIAEHSGDESNDENNEFSSDENEDEDDEEYLEEDLQQNIKKPPPKLNLSLKKQQESILKDQKPSKVTLPKLQLKKAKQIQNLIIKKINHDEKKKANASVKDEKWKKLEVQMQEMRKKLGNEIIHKMKFERQNNFLKRFINELEQRNQLLLKERRDDNMEKDYERERELNKEQNVESLLDICRDVTLNERLRSVCKGKDQLVQKRDIYSKQI